MISVVPTPRLRPVLASALGLAVSAAVLVAPPQATAAPGASPSAAVDVVSTRTLATGARGTADRAPVRNRTVLRPTASTWIPARVAARGTPRLGPLRVRKGHAAAFIQFESPALANRAVVDAELRLRVRHHANRGGVVVAAGGKRLNSRSTVPAARWVTVSLDRMPRRLGGGRLVLRLTAERASGYDYFGRRGLLAPALVLVTEEVRPDLPPDPDPTPPKGVARVFAHYFPPYPISFDDAPADQDYYAQGYLARNGEGGIHASYGGLLRDRPTPRAPLGGDYELKDMRTEIRNAKAAGVQGFQIDILGLGEGDHNWRRTMALVEAADEAGDFVIVPMLDMTSLRTQSAETVAAATAKILQHPSAQVIGGEKVVSSFCAECRGVDWWSSVIDLLEGKHGIPVKFVATFIGPQVNDLRRFAPIAYGAGAWGTRNADGALRAPNLAAVAQGLGMTWMSSVAVQDVRHKGGNYAEAGNTETLRATWERAVADGADFVQLTTWNDYSESSGFAPSVAHGRVFVELNRFFADQFRTGKPSRITEDRVYVTHRIQKWDAMPADGNKRMTSDLGGSQVAPRDTAEALVMLTEPATVTLRSGANTVTRSLPAGLSAFTVPLDFGQVSAEVVRGGRTVASVVSDHTVVRTPATQDLQYYAAGSA
jgi:hypothetical protein